MRAASIRYVDVGRGKQRRSPRFDAARISRISGTSTGGSHGRLQARRNLPLRVRVPRSRLRGSTGCKSKREAQEFERAKRQEAAKEAERREALGRAPLTWGVAASRYWQEAGQHHSRYHGTLASLEWLTRHIGEATPLAADQRLACRPAGRQAAGRWRRAGDRQPDRDRAAAPGAQPGALWGESVPPIEWRKHMLAEPRERVRELRADEEEALFAALRPDYHAIVRFALLTGCRLRRVRRTDLGAMSIGAGG